MMSGGCCKNLRPLIEKTIRKLFLLPDKYVPGGLFCDFTPHEDRLSYEPAEKTKSTWCPKGIKIKGGAQKEPKYESPSAPKSAQKNQATIRWTFWTSLGFNGTL